MKKNKVFIGLSGGVDSSVAALLLKDRGYAVTGVFIRSYNLDGCAEQDAADARLVANKLDIPFYVFDFEKEYKREVVDYMVHGYRSGLTPNPDVMCNKYIKFGFFLERALSLGADYIATGHYVRIAPRNNYRGAGRGAAGAAPRGFDARPIRSVGDQTESVSETFRQDNPEPPVRYSLFEAKDKNKDQSYFLWTLTQRQLRYCLFPIGDYLKSEVRAMARKAGLPTAQKKDSQGICFLGKVTLQDFLKDYIPVKRGEIMTIEGQVIGEHKGAQFYTVGQRHGLDLKEKNAVLGLKVRSATEPHYIVSKDVTANTVVVAAGSNHPSLFRREIELTDLNLTNGAGAFGRFNRAVSVLARVRYRQPLAPAKLKIDGSRLLLCFDEPVKFIAPGQSAVFYDQAGEMLGGAVIV